MCTEKEIANNVFFEIALKANKVAGIEAGAWYLLKHLKLVTPAMTVADVPETTLQKALCSIALEYEFDSTISTLFDRSIDRFYSMKNTQLKYTHKKLSPTKGN